MYCKKCGKQIDDDSAFCVHCGTPLVSAVGHAPVQDSAPIIEEPKKKKKKSVFKRWWFWVIVLILLLGSCGGSGDDGTDSDDALSSEQQTEVYISNEDAFVSEFCAGSGLSEETAKSVYGLLTNDLLCTDVEFFQKSAIGNALWEVHTSNYSLKVAADDEGIYSVRCGDYEMYDGANVLYTCEDLAARDTTEHRSYYLTIAMNIVEGSLKAPSTAEFQSSAEMGVARNGELVAVEGYVDAQNGFGAMIRSEFVVEFRVIDIESLTYETVYIQIDDKTAGEFINLD